MSSKPTPQQQAVIDQQSGRIVVQACPGSGKTATLVRRTAALPAEDTKLVLAFNKAAATEFSDRMGAISGADVRTFHSFCFREVMSQPKNFGYRSKPTLDNGSFFGQLVNANIDEFGMGKLPRGWDETDWDEDFIKTAQHSLYNRQLAQIADRRAEGEAAEREQASARALLRYRDWLLSKGITTFDSMVHLVAEHRDKLRRAGQHVMIDEYQDVDRFQFDTALALASLPGVKSFTVVGDPNQRIYEWRGALLDAFGDAKRALDPTVLGLTTNFRSTNEILAHAETICRVGMSGVRGSVPGSVKYIDPVTRDTDVPQRAAIARDLTKGLDRLSDAAILCRYNRDAAAWQLALAKSGIPVFLLGRGDFWQSKHIKLALEAREKGKDLIGLFESPDWRKFVNRKKFIEDEDALAEVQDDARWILSLTRDELDLLRRVMQDEAGVVISSIHKVKGREWPRVLVSGVTERLLDETFVYYVACTRPRDLLILG